VKLLLTSGGVTNPTIHATLVELLGKRVADCHALIVPTAQWGHPQCGPQGVRRLIAADPSRDSLAGLGWASLGVLELAALPTIEPERWVPWVREADVLDAFPTNTMADAELWATGLGVPAYAIDEQTAIRVVEGAVEVVSEGRWRKFDA
jgi:hypothetical protein